MSPKPLDRSKVEPGSNSVNVEVGVNVAPKAVHLVEFQKLLEKIRDRNHRTPSLNKIEKLIHHFESFTDVKNFCNLLVAAKAKGLGQENEITKVSELYVYTLLMQRLSSMAKDPTGQSRIMLTKIKLTMEKLLTKLKASYLADKSPAVRVALSDI